MIPHVIESAELASAVSFQNPGDPESASVEDVAVQTSLVLATNADERQRFRSFSEGYGCADVPLLCYNC